MVGKSNKVNTLVSAIRVQNADNKAKLLAKFRKDKKFLLSTMMLWVNKEHHSKLIALWPPTGKATKE